MSLDLLSAPGVYRFKFQIYYDPELTMIVEDEFSYSNEFEVTD